MSTYNKVLLSGSTNGKLIKIVPTGTIGTTIHTAVAGPTSMDEIWLFAVNTQATNVKLTIEYGGVTSPDCLIEITIPGESGLVPILPGLLLQSGLLVTAFAATANVIMIGGFVHRIVP